MLDNINNDILLRGLAALRLDASQLMHTLGSAENAKSAPPQFWLSRINTTSGVGLGAEADMVVEEIARQREQRGLWHPARITGLKTLHSQLVQTLAMDPIAVERATYHIEYNVRATLDTISGRQVYSDREMRMLQQALRPFFANS